MPRPPYWPKPDTPIAAASWREARRVVLDLLRAHGAGLALLFLGVLAPLWAFSELADEVHEAEVIAFDRPLLEFARSMSGDLLDRVFLFVSAIGHGWGVIPASVGLVIALALMRHYRRSAFAAAALGGSALLNMAAKLFFARERPTLWDSVVQETTYSFPSGHAMGSMALATACILLAWRTRWRMPVIVGMGAFAMMVGFSRVYLGVHYPSDILAGWAAAAAWVSGCYALVFGWPRLRRKLPSRRRPSRRAR